LGVRPHGCQDAAAAFSAIKCSNKARDFLLSHSRDRSADLVSAKSLGSDEKESTEKETTGGLLHLSEP
jgi:hypothetical protein